MLQRQLEGLSGNLTKQKNLSNTQDLLHRVQNSKYEVGVYDEHVTGKVGSTLSFPGAHDTPLPGSETRHAPRGGPKATIKDVPLKVLPDDAKYNKALQLQCKWRSAVHDGWRVGCVTMLVFTPLLPVNGQVCVLAADIRSATTSRALHGLLPRRLLPTMLRSRLQPTT